MMKNNVVGIFLPLFICFNSILLGQSINGVVIDEETDNVLPGAHVQLIDNFKAVTTNAKGEFTISGLKSGGYQLLTSYMGFQNDTLFIQVKDKAEVNLTIKLKPGLILSDEYLIIGVRSKEAPIATTTINHEQLNNQNLGQDMPVLLNWTPSLVSTSDAGAGIGYTGMRIRGSDQTRINVTVNGIPINDAESQGVFWVNMPDFAGSTQSIQIQRGVGSSTNGAGSFGASVNMNTNTLKSESYGNLSLSGGSFNTFKKSVGFGTGLLNNHWVIDGRLSAIESEGYIDRASSDLKSYYLSGGYYRKSTVIKFITFSGKEETYQSWYGTPQSRLENDKEKMMTHISNNSGTYSTEAQRNNLLNSGRTYNYYLYDNEVDHYNQDHYQVHLSQKIGKTILMNAALHFTHGEGYFEQYVNDENPLDYGINPVMADTGLITETDVIRRRWLDNDFYGFTFSFVQNLKKFRNTLGGAYNTYEGGHFGELIWAQYAANSTIRDKFYNNDATKNDANVFIKSEFLLNSSITIFTDVQARAISYKANGLDINNSTIDVDTNYVFINPKVGFRYKVNGDHQLFGFFGIGNREPVRNDILDAPQGQTPKHETLNDLELGYLYQGEDLYFNLNIYNMSYKNQLVLTGELNDVGSAIRKNVDKSFRRGVEFEIGYQFSKWIKWLGNVTYSQNKIEEFEEVLYDYTDFTQVTEKINVYKNSDISFSPDLIAGSQLFIYPIKKLEVGVLSKYVGEQYMDNTSNADRSISSYLVNDLRFIYRIKSSKLKELRLSFLVNNIMDKKYSSNGYTYSYIYSDLITENFYYPQAGRNYLIGLNLSF